MSSYCKFVARESLRGNWGQAVLFTFVAGLLGADGGASSSSSSSSWRNNLSPEARQVLTVILFILVVLAVVWLFLGPSVELGLKLYNTRLIHGYRQQTIGTLFERCDIFWKAFGLRLLGGLFIFLWSLLFIIPGIVAAYRYAMAPYLMAHYPEMGILEALDHSKRMMDGYKTELFVLHISFIGWSLLCVLTLGIGFLWLSPYTYASEAAFYLHRMQQLPEQYAS